MKRLKTKHAIDTPPIFYRKCREKEGKLERWLAERPQLSYEASDFELPADLEIDSLLGFLAEEVVDGAEEARGGVGGERVVEEVAEDANLANGNEVVRRDE
ncbi:unnamed protein product [Cochlearia groenlandica]